MYQLMRSPIAWLLATFALCAGACHPKPETDPNAATRENFARGTVAYLAARGELCLGKEFPLDVTERELASGARNAVQMPVLEHVGLVTSAHTMGQVTTESGPVAVPVTRFSLTDTGRQFYRVHAGAAVGEKQHGDLCVAKLSLGKVVSFDMAEDKRSAVVSYTYHVEAAPWTRVPEVKAVFPAVDRVLVGAESALLKEGFTLTNEGWVANELLPPAPQPVAKNAIR